MTFKVICRNEDGQRLTSMAFQSYDDAQAEAEAWAKYPMRMYPHRPIVKTIEIVSSKTV
jgi:hypothetical protein